MSDNPNVPLALPAVEKQAASLAATGFSTIMNAAPGTEPSWAKPAVAITAMVIFAGMLVYSYATHDQATAKLLAGGAMGMASTAVSYYLGSSSGSAHKTALLAAAPAIPPAPTTPAGA